MENDRKSKSLANKCTLFFACGGLEKVRFDSMAACGAFCVLVLYLCGAALGGQDAQDDRALLIQRLRSDDSSRRLAAAITLSEGRIADTPEEQLVAAILISGLEGKGKDVRKDSARAIRNLSVITAVVHPLLKALEDSDDTVREQAARTLANYGKHTNTIRSALVKLQDHQDAGVRATATGLMGNTRLDLGVTAVPHLVRALGDKNPGVREAALHGIGNNAADVKETLASVARVAYTDKEANLRKLAVEILGCLGPRAVPDLAEILLGNDDALRQVAVRGLGKQIPESKEGLKALIRAAGNEEMDYDTRYLAVYLLKNAGPAGRDAIPVLKRLLGYPAAQMQMNAAETLRCIEAFGAPNQ